MWSKPGMAKLESPQGTHSPSNGSDDTGGHVLSAYLSTNVSNGGMVIEDDPIRISNVVLDKNLADLDVDLATVTQLYAVGASSLEISGWQPSPGPKPVIQKLTFGLWQWTQPIRFVSHEMEARFQEWNSVQQLPILRLAVVSINVTFCALIADMLLQSSGWIDGLSIALLVVLVALQGLAAAFIWWQQPCVQFPWPLEVRNNLAAAIATAATILMGVLKVICWPWEWKLSDGFVSFGIQVALIIFLCDALRPQITVFLACVTASHLVWIGLMVSQNAVPPIMLLVCIPLIAIHKARILHRTHANRRFEFQLQLRLVRHISQLKHSQAALADQRVRAVKATTAREIHQAILGYACHELRNPLHGLRGCLEEVMATCKPSHPVDASDIWNLESMFAAVDQMTRITDDVLDFNKLQAGKLQVAHRASDLRSIVERVAVQYRASNTGIEVHIAPDVPESICSDPLRVAQVLTNGVTNALKHTFEGQPVQIVVAVNSETVLFEVQNRGTGLKFIDTDRLFQIYERGGDETSQSIRGIGLGLPICKMLIELLGGDIGLEDRGPITVFWFRLPLKCAAMNHGALQVALGDTSLSSMSLESSKEGKPIMDGSSVLIDLAPGANDSFWGPKPELAPPVNVLIVDDELVNRRILARMLLNLGHHPTELADGDEVLAALQGGLQVDLCFMDVHMARSNGCDVTMNLRTAGYAFPILATTGNCSKSDAAMYARAGFSGMLGKPFALTDVQRVMAFLCDKPV